MEIFEHTFDNYLNCVIIYNDYQVYIQICQLHYCVTTIMQHCQTLLQSW